MKVKTQLTRTFGMQQSQVIAMRAYSKKRRPKTERSQIIKSMMYIKVLEKKKKKYKLNSKLAD
jgi:hypothetical protein